MLLDVDGGSPDQPRYRSRWADAEKKKPLNVDSLGERCERDFASVHGGISGYMVPA